MSSSPIARYNSAAFVCGIVSSGERRTDRKRPIYTWWVRSQGMRSLIFYNNVLNKPHPITVEVDRCRGILIPGALYYTCSIGYLMRARKCSTPLPLYPISRHAALCVLYLPPPPLPHVTTTACLLAPMELIAPSIVHPFNHLAAMDLGQGH